MGKLSSDAIVITGIGMNTSLGNAVTACAAARAGLSAARVIDGFTVLCNDGSDGEMVGHPTRTAPGFRGLGKALALGLAGLRDLLKNSANFETLLSHRMGLCLALPDLESRVIFRSQESSGAERVHAPSFGESLCARLAVDVPLGVSLKHQKCFERGNAGFGLALTAAMEHLHSGAWHSCVVGAIDSLLEEPTLDWLLDWGRLKTVDKSDGLVPGEAAAFLLLERHDSAIARNAKVMACLDGVEIGREAKSLMLGEPSRGEGLGKAISALARKIVGKAALMSDQNGEYYRTHELANARLLAGQEHPWLLNAGIEYPATSFGDTGAASGALGLGLVARGLSRGYMQEEAWMILLSSDRELRSVAAISRAE